MEKRLPMVINSNLPIEKKRNVFRLRNQFQRIGKILANAGISMVGLGTLALGNPVVSLVGGTVYLLAGTNTLKNVVFKKEKGSMFMTRKNLKGELVISQDITALREISKMKGFQQGEKGILMGLQMLVGLQSYKQQYSDQNKSTELSRDGNTRVYPQTFVAQTHGINIKTIEALEKLGYIQIERNEPKKQSILFFERMAFQQYKEALNGLVARVSGKEDELHQYQKQMYEIAFKITDKQMNFEEIYRQYQEMKNTRGINPIRKPLRRIGILFDGLRRRDIDIYMNKLGMYEIDYNAQQSFAERIDGENISENRAKKFREGQKTEMLEQQVDRGEISNQLMQIKEEEER